VLEAVRLPKATPDQQQARDRALEEAYRDAACVPLTTARLCLEVIRLAGEAAEKGNVNSASDAGVAALVARAGVEGACLNVLVNLGSVSDAAFKDACRLEVRRLRDEAGSALAVAGKRVAALIG
jgi:formiminotetrahydrofolate cyclodeaminase